MRYRSAAFALKSAHALASPGSTYFPARGVDADALLGTAALLYLLRFSGDIVRARTHTWLQAPSRRLSRVPRNDGVAEAEQQSSESGSRTRFMFAPVQKQKNSRKIFHGAPGRGARGARRLSRVTIARDCASTAAAPSPRMEFVTQIARRRQRRRAASWTQSNSPTNI